MQVLKRDGRLQDVRFDKITHRIRNLVDKKKVLQVDPARVVQKVCASLYDKIPTSDIDVVSAEVAVALAMDHPDYATLAAHIMVSNLHRNTAAPVREAFGRMRAMLRDDVWAVIDAHAERLDAMIDFSKDFSYDFFAIRTLERLYLTKKDGKIVERPQHLLLRVALGIWVDDLERVEETYRAMSDRLCTHATPTLFNAGMKNGQFSSCFLLGMDDSIEGIYKALADCAQISKWAGGIGIHLHNIRSRNAPIRGTNGVSSGIVPMLRVFNNTARYVNQCFTPDTPVVTADGVKRIADVRPGVDRVFTRDHTYRWVLESYKNPAPPEGVLRIVLANGRETRVTRAHDIFARREGVWQFHEAGTLVVGDTVAHYDASLRYDPQPIASIQPEPYVGDVYDLNVQDNHNYLVESLGIVHNSGRRNGSFAMYLEPWHPDVFDFLDAKKNHGDEEQRARDLFYALWIPDLFMRRVEENGVWSLMDPDACKWLPDTYGEDFDALYEQYEAEGRYVRQVDAQKLWFAILESQIETGTPYLCYKDACNRKSNQNNLGTIRSSNLCVAGETEILTWEFGNAPIATLVGRPIRVWNGLEWSETRIYQTSRDAELLRIVFSNGSVLDCTEYHKFYVSNMIEKRAADLASGDVLSPWVWPDGTAASEIVVASVSRTGRRDPTYCFSERKRHMGVFNNILTGNCSEIIEYSSPEETAVCLAGDTRVLTRTGWQRIDAIADGTDVYSPYASDDSFDPNPTPFTPAVLVPNGEQYVYTIHVAGSRPIRATANHKFMVRLGRGEYCWKRTDQLLMGDEMVVAENDPLPGYETFPFEGEAARLARDIAATYAADGRISNGGISLASADRNVLFDMQESLILFGIYAKVDWPGGRGRLVICGRKNVERFLAAFPSFGDKDSTALLDEVGRMRNVRYVHMVADVEDCGVVPVFDLHVPATRHFVVNGGVVTHNCNLASVALPAFVRGAEYDFHGLYATTKIVARNLDRVIDRTFYPTEAARRSNTRHRPIGIGVQGLADVFQMLDLPFDSDAALELNRKMFETMYYAAIETSTELAEELGPYETYLGSPASAGTLQYDLWGGETPTFNAWDWHALKEKVARHGLRNSLSIALMPTASTSQLLGNTECVEPITSNIYTRRTMAGEFVVVNRHLVRALMGLGRWNPDVRDAIIAAGGSVQGIPDVPESVKEVFKTAWEMKQKALIDLAANRGPFVCQSQSLNLFVTQPTFKKLSSMHFYSWKAGLKTGIYYLRTQAASMPVPVALASERGSAALGSVPAERGSVAEDDSASCLMCSA